MNKKTGTHMTDDCLGSYIYFTFVYLGFKC